MQRRVHQDRIPGRACKSYRLQTDPASRPSFGCIPGAPSTLPSFFISGTSDWGVYQRSGRLEAMRHKICTDLRGIHLLDGAGHWVQQEQHEAVSRLMLESSRVRRVESRRCQKRSGAAGHPLGARRSSPLRSGRSEPALNVAKA